MLQDKYSEIMKEFLSEFYSKDDFDLIEVSFLLRNTLQYYVGQNANKKDLTRVWDNAYPFFVKSRDILIKLNGKRVKKIRDDFLEATKNE